MCFQRGRRFAGKSTKVRLEGPAEAFIKERKQISDTESQIIPERDGAGVPDPAEGPRDHRWTITTTGANKSRQGLLEPFKPLPKL